jgi:hypothetical protein
MASTLAAANHAGMGLPRMAAAVAVLLTLGASPGARAAPASFHLVFDGRHNAAFLHEGTFSTSLTLCTSGSAEDTSVDATTDTATRRFTCVEGGSFTAKIAPLPAEHGGSGSWQIVAGSGPLAGLRGKGTFSSTRSGGRTDDPATITFRSTWDGIADFDVDPPTIAVASSSAKKLKRPKGSYSVRLRLTFTGDLAVSYVLQVVDPKKPGNAFAYKLGSTTNGSASQTFRIRPPKNLRTVALEIDAEDAVGNAASFAKALRLR